MTESVWPGRSLFGAAPDELHRRTGAMHQLARVESLVHADGPARGSRLIRMVSAGGLEVDVHPDRSLDLGLARFRGIPLTWLSATGIPAPGLAEDDGNRWLRTFGGGLLATCGLDAFGPASVDEGIEYGLHGRVGRIPATVRTAEVTASELVVRGEVRQVEVFGTDLLLTRALRMPIDGSRLEVVDTVTNMGFEAAGHMVLYHLNFGWPLIDENVVIDIPARSVVPVNAAAHGDPEGWRAFEAPRHAAEEQVYQHDFTKHGTGTAVVDNAALGVRVELSFDTGTLPALMQWRLPAEGNYVLGLEPANTLHLGGRASARAAKLLPSLLPGASVEHRVELRVGPSVTTRRDREEPEERRAP